jgi:hypothetical protein
MGALAGPLILAGGSIAGSLIGRRGGTPEPSALEQEGILRSFGQAGRLGQAGRDFTGAGLAQTSQAGSFFSNLLSGNRGALLSATAPERNATISSFRGAEQNLRERGGRSGTEALASQLLSRDRAAALAGTTQGVRAGAATSLANIGLGQSQLGLGATANAGNLFQGLAATQQAGRLGAANIDANRQAGGGQLGGFLFDVLQNTKGKGGGGSFRPGPGTIEASPPISGIPSPIGTPLPPL